MFPVQRESMRSDGLALLGVEGASEVRPQEAKEKTAQTMNMEADRRLLEDFPFGGPWRIP